MYKKKKIPYGVFGVLFFVFCLAGYFLSGLFILPGVNMDNLEDNLYYILSHPFTDWSNAKTPGMIGAAVCVWMLLVSYYLNTLRNFQTDEHGSENWADVALLNKELADGQEQNNRILSKNLQISLENGLSNNNMLVLGSSGTFKTTSLMHTNLMVGGSSYVILDVKGDTQRKLAHSLKEKGYTIWSLNLKDFSKSDRYNPFLYIETEDDLNRQVKGLQESVRPPQNTAGADPFWNDGVRLYLQALFYYEWLDARETNRQASMNGILKLVNLESEKASSAKNSDSKLHVLMEKKADTYGDNYPPVRFYRKLKDGAPETVKSIVIMINSMLSLCETAEVERIFSGNDFNLRELGTGIGGDPGKKAALFLIIPDNNSAYNFIVSMLYTQLFDILIRLSDQELCAPLPCRVEVWMDEFYAGARPAETEVLLGVVRSRNISMVILLQSISQIMTLFPNNKWEIFMDNVAATCYLGSGPLAKSTHEFISASLGKGTYDTRSDNMSKGKNGSFGLNFGRAGRELMTPTEVKRMNRTNCLIFLEGRQPVFDQKAIPFDVPKDGYYGPEKLKKMYSQALAMGDYVHPVEVYYDKTLLHYYTFEPEKSLYFPDEREAAYYLETAKNDSRIHVLEVDEKELLYLNFQQKKLTDQEIDAAFQEAILREQEQLQYQKANLIVMRPAEGKETLKEEPSPKDGWDRTGSLQECLDRYYGQLGVVEQEIIDTALAEGLEEETILQLIFLPQKQMEYLLNQHRAAKKKKG